MSLNSYEREILLDHLVPGSEFKPIAFWLIIKLRLSRMGTVAGTLY